MLDQHQVRGRSAGRAPVVDISARDSMSEDIEDTEMVSNLDYARCRLAICSTFAASGPSSSVFLLIATGASSL